MGTRSTTKIYEQYTDGSKELLLAIYKQYDGYTDGFGTDLKDFIKKCLIVNGISGGYPEGKLVCNGAGCFALQLVNEFKEGAGGVYATSKDDEQEYNYEITFKYKDNKHDVIEFVCKDEPEFNETFKVADNGEIEQ